MLQLPAAGDNAAMQMDRPRSNGSLLDLQPLMIWRPTREDGLAVVAGQLEGFTQAALFPGDRIMSCGLWDCCWIGTAAFAFAAVALIGWHDGARCVADDTPAEKPATARATPSKAPTTGTDPFVVPEGKPPALMSFIAKMRRMKPPKNASDEEKKVFWTKSHTVMLEAADKVLETNPLGTLRVAVLKAKIEALLCSASKETMRRRRSSAISPTN